MPISTPPTPVAMPDYSQGSLSANQKEILTKFLVDKWGKGNPKGMPKCERCGDETAAWVVGQHVVTPVQFVNGNIQLGGVVYPYIAVSCSNCGNTHFVNAITAGVLTHIGGGQLREAVPNQG